MNLAHASHSGSSLAAARRTTVALMEMGDRMVASHALTRASDELAEWSRTRTAGPWDFGLKPDDVAATFDLFPSSRSAAASAAASSGMLQSASDLLISAASRTEDSVAIAEALNVKQAAAMVQQIGYDVGAGNHRTAQLPATLVNSLRGWVHTLENHVVTATSAVPHSVYTAPRSRITPSLLTPPHHPQTRRSM